MFCKNCGNEIDDNADVCIKCGHAVKPVRENEKDYNEPKTGIGVLLSLLLGVIGLAIGLLMYPANTIARKTFIKAWGITFGVSIGVILVIYLIAIIAVVGTMSYY